MIATIELYQPLHEHLKTVNKRGRVKELKHVVIIGPFVKICPSASSAYKYLGKMGFTFDTNTGNWEHKYKSEEIQNLERNYRKA